MKKYTAWILVIVWMGLIFYLSAQPSKASSALSSGITEVVVNGIHELIPSSSITLEDLHFWIRKAAHFSAYFLLGILTLIAWKGSGIRGVRAMIYAWILSVLYAATDEFHQLFVPGRSGEVRDVLIDCTGALTGIVLYWFVVLVVNRVRK